MAEEWLRRCLWGEGRSKPKPKAKMSTFRVRSSKKTAGRAHMNLFVRLVVLNEGGCKSSRILQQRASSVLLFLTRSSADPAADLSWGGRAGAFPSWCHTHRGTNPGSAGSGPAFI